MRLSQALPCSCMAAGTCVGRASWLMESRCAARVLCEQLFVAVMLLLPSVTPVCAGWMALRRTCVLIASSLVATAAQACCRRPGMPSCASCGNRDFAVRLSVGPVMYNWRYLSKSCGWGSVVLWQSLLCQAALFKAAVSMLSCLGALPWHLLGSTAVLPCHNVAACDAVVLQQLVVGLPCSCCI